MYKMSLRRYGYYRAMILQEIRGLLGDPAFSLRPPLKYDTSKVYIKTLYCIYKVSSYSTVMYVLYHRTLYSLDLFISHINIVDIYMYYTVVYFFVFYP